VLYSIAIWTKADITEVTYLTLLRSYNGGEERYLNVDLPLSNTQID
jgi:hypothetical protein